MYLRQALSLLLLLVLLGPEPSTPSFARAPVTSAGDLVVQLEPGASIGQIDRRYGTRVLETMPDGYYRLALPTRGNPSKILQALHHDPGILGAEPNYALSERFRRYFVETGSEIDPTAEPFSSNYQQQWAGTAIELPGALTVSHGQGITVAVIDTAVDESHPILGEALLPGYSTIGAGHISYNTAGAPHGTFVAGLIHFVAPAASILPIAALTDDGNGNVWDVAQAIRLAADLGAQVINLSLGTSHDSTVLDDAVAYAQQQGVVVVASAGNDGAANAPHYPSDLAGVLSVAALDGARVKADFSNFGNRIVVSAPGVDTYSTYPNNGYALASGTSLAAALVSGEAALVLASHPTIDAWAAESIIVSATTDLSAANAPALSGLLGAGQIDASKAVRWDTTIGGGAPPKGGGTPGDPASSSGATPAATDNPPVSAENAPTPVTTKGVSQAVVAPVPPTPTDVPPTPITVGPSATDVAPTATEAVPTPTDLVPTPTNVTVQATEAVPTDTAVVPTATEPPPTPPDDTPTPPDNTPVPTAPGHLHDPTS